MRMFGKKTIEGWREKMGTLPWVPVERGPRGGIGWNFFVLRGSHKFQREFRSATARAGHKRPPDEPGERISDYAMLDRREMPSGKRRVAVVYAWETVGYTPTDELRRIHRVLDKCNSDQICVEIWLHKAASGGWNARILV